MLKKAPTSSASSFHHTHFLQATSTRQQCSPTLVENFCLVHDGAVPLDAKCRILLRGLSGFHVDKGCGCHWCLSYRSSKSMSFLFEGNSFYVLSSSYVFSILRLLNLGWYFH